MKVLSPVCFRLVRYVNLSGSSEDLVLLRYWLRPKKKKNWRNRLLKNGVGRSVIFFSSFYPAVCPFIHTNPVYIFIKT